MFARVLFYLRSYNETIPGVLELLAFKYFIIAAVASST